MRSSLAFLLFVTWFGSEHAARPESIQLGGIIVYTKVEESTKLGGRVERTKGEEPVRRDERADNTERQESAVRPMIAR